MQIEMLKSELAGALSALGNTRYIAFFKITMGDADSGRTARAPFPGNSGRFTRSGRLGAGDDKTFAFIFYKSTPEKQGRIRNTIIPLFHPFSAAFRRLKS